MDALLSIVMGGSTEPIAFFRLRAALDHVLQLAEISITSKPPWLVATLQETLSNSEHDCSRRCSSSVEFLAEGYDCRRLLGNGRYGWIVGDVVRTRV